MGRRTSGPPNWDAAGDVNGDGYSDVIVGALFFSNGQTDEGRGFVYYGIQGAGLAVIPAQLNSASSSGLHQCHPVHHGY